MVRCNGHDADLLRTRPPPFQDPAAVTSWTKCSSSLDWFSRDGNMSSSSQRSRRPVHVATSLDGQHDAAVSTVNADAPHFHGLCRWRCRKLSVRSGGLHGHGRWTPRSLSHADWRRCLALSCEVLVCLPPPLKLSVTVPGRSKAYRIAH